MEDVKAQDIQVFDTTPITTLFDRVVLASGTSNRQTRALAKSVHDKVREAGAPVLSMEGTDTGEWVLVDLGDVVVHIMQPVTRDHFRLEDIWGEVSVSLEEITKLFRKKAPARKPATKQPSRAKPASGQGAAEKHALTKKPLPRQPAASTPATEKPSSKKTPAKKPAAKTPTGKKPASSKAPAKRPAAPKPPTGKPAAETPSAKKPAAKKKAAPK
ncbi:Protein Iojap/ribosomal silencing factor RsfS [Burkholderiales bacterium]